MFVLVPVCVLVYMYVHQCVVTCFPVSECNLIVNIWGPQTIRGYRSLSFKFPCNEEQRVVLNYFFREYNSTKDNYKPAIGSL